MVLWTVTYITFSKSPYRTAKSRIIHDFGSRGKLHDGKDKEAPKVRTKNFDFTFLKKFPENFPSSSFPLSLA
jgi:hypothetical protein